MAGFEMRRRVIEEHPRGRVVMVDTIAHVHADDAGQVVVCGSHGGVSSGEYAAVGRPLCEAIRAVLRGLGHA